MEVPQGEVHTYAYPGFDTDAFWRGYSESARQFVHVASYLAAPLSALDRLQHAELTGEDEMMIQQALQRIDVIASVVDIWGWLGEDEGLGIGWISPSLLGMFALMMLSDLKAGHQVRRCPN